MTDADHQQAIAAKDLKENWAEAVIHLESCYKHSMNNYFLHGSIPQGTRAVDDMPRRRWTVAEIDAMVRAGVIDEGERFELIDGDAVPMSPKNSKHETYKNALLRYWIKAVSDEFQIIPETTLRLGEATFLEPDLLFFRTSTRIEGLSGSTSLLAVELSDTTLAYDRGRKALIYSRHGVRALWVVDVNTLDTYVFGEASPDGYRSMKVFGSHELLVPEFASELSVRLSDLPLY